MSSTRHWLKSYPDAVSDEIDADAYRSIVELFEIACLKFQSRPAFSSFGKTISYGELDELSRCFAAYLRSDLGLKKGDRVAIMLPNCLQYPVSLFGALRAGLTVVNVNPLYTPRELRHQLVDSGAVAIVVMDNYAGTLQQVMAETKVRYVVTTGLGDLLGLPKGLMVNFVVKHIRKLVPSYAIKGAVRFMSALNTGGFHKLPTVPIAQDDIAFLQYTGGTTGVPMGAMLTHRNLVANMQQTFAWIVPAGLVPGEEVAVTALPLYHVYALTTHLLMMMRLGGLNHLITDPRDMSSLVREITSIRFSLILGVNTLFNALLDAPGFDRVDFSGLKFCFGGGASIHRGVAERWLARTGRPIVEGYGLTEASPIVSINTTNLMDHKGSIGLPVPSTDVCIKGEDGRVLPIGEVGELCVKGPQVMRGYWKQPEATARAIDSEGWLHTGDMARFDEAGLLYLVDRKKDMILVSGFNVYPNEVEDVIARMPGVKEVAALGVPSPKSGEAVKIVVVRRDASLTEADIKSYARANLTGYKRPHLVEFRDELPKSNVGKILRRELRSGS
ncbi:MAG TPA: AMP-binding protein [Dyella sp.]|uniref:AMP-binding protein n=1 Tax=Dyella sp. TaxID=1869338 RepID=UPI002D768E77|nr:AMP-binding protein [Dyella sp.]HET6554197.1 AMP-binding protein [Dyella sp.]